MSIAKDATSKKQRKPVDALQYEKLALSATRSCEQHVEQFEKIVALAIAIGDSRGRSRQERQQQRALLQLLIDTAEDYQTSSEVDLELFKVVAVEAKGFPNTQLNGRQAVDLLAEALVSTQATSEGKGTADGSPGRTSTVAVSH